jgi:selenocysteine-specific elongation factor
MPRPISLPGSWLPPLGDPAEEAHGVTLGTAGHIDHGKTALIQALTGVNTDRLPEERRRGLSIELGFAELELPSGQRLSVVDVPGHERLIRTMVSGATGIDLFLLVVAADDGVMPQTREHVAVLRALAIDRGLVALTKIDVVSVEQTDGARAQIGTLLPGVRVVEVSAHTGTGVDELKAALAELAAEVHRANLGSGRSGEGAVLHVDRVFTIRGAGTVVTGTLRSGSIRRGDRLRVLPREVEPRVRGLHTHGRELDRAFAGHRVAVNLARIGRADVERGDVLASREATVTATYRLDVQLALEPHAGAIGGTRVQVHHGTRDAPARVVELGDGRAQLRLEAPLFARAGERLVVRRIAPPDTIGGALIVDPAPRRHGPATVVEESLGAGSGAVPGLRSEAESQEAGEAKRKHDQREGTRLDGVPLRVLAALRADADAPRGRQALAEGLGLKRGIVERALEQLVAAGLVVRIKPDIHYPAEKLDELRERITRLAAPQGEITLGQLRDLLKTSRKYAQALLEHLDGAGITVRRGDIHVLLKRRSRGGGGPPRR